MSSRSRLGRGGEIHLLGNIYITRDILIINMNYCLIKNCRAILKPFVLEWKRCMVLRAWGRGRKVSICLDSLFRFFYFSYWRMIWCSWHDSINCTYHQKKISYNFLQSRTYRRISNLVKLLKMRNDGSSNNEMWRNVGFY